MKRVNILSEINDNPNISISLKLLDSLEREVIRLPNYRCSILYVLRVGDEFMECPVTLSREFVEEIKAGQHTKIDEYIFQGSLAEAFKKEEKQLYRESRLKKLINK